MSLATKKYLRNPLEVDAVRVGTDNFEAIAKWCEGEILTEGGDALKAPGKSFIKIWVHNPLNQRQMKAFVGDWILKSEMGFKIYTNRAFQAAFSPAADVQYPRMDGGFIVIGPDCFAQHDGSVLSWKGTNYVPQNVPAEVA